MQLIHSYVPTIFSDKHVVKKSASKAEWNVITNISFDRVSIQQSYVELGTTVIEENLKYVFNVK